MTTKEAFEQLTSKRGWYTPLEISKNEAWNARKRFVEGTISIEKMEEILEKAGYKVVQEKKWTT